jgi:hypothetical protein
MLSFCDLLVACLVFGVCETWIGGLDKQEAKRVEIANISIELKVA